MDTIQSSSGSSSVAELKLQARKMRENEARSFKNLLVKPPPNQKLFGPPILVSRIKDSTHERISKIYGTYDTVKDYVSSPMLVGAVFNEPMTPAPSFSCSSSFSRSIIPASPDEEPSSSASGVLSQSDDVHYVSTPRQLHDTQYFYDIHTVDKNSIKSPESHGNTRQNLFENFATRKSDNRSSATADSLLTSKNYLESSASSMQSPAITGQITPLRQQSDCRATPKSWQDSDERLRRSGSSASDILKPVRTWSDAREQILSCSSPTSQDSDRGSIKVNGKCSNVQSSHCVPHNSAKVQEIANVLKDHCNSVTNGTVRSSLSNGSVGLLSHHRQDGAHVKDKDNKKLKLDVTPHDVGRGQLKDLVTEAIQELTVKPLLSAIVTPKKGISAPFLNGFATEVRSDQCKFFNISSPVTTARESSLLNNEESCLISTTPVDHLLDQDLELSSDSSDSDDNDDNVVANRQLKGLAQKQKQSLINVTGDLSPEDKVGAVEPTMTAANEKRLAREDVTNRSGPRLKSSTSYISHSSSSDSDGNEEDSSSDSDNSSDKDECSVPPKDKLLPSATCSAEEETTSKNLSWGIQNFVPKKPTPSLGPTVDRELMPPTQVASSKSADFNHFELLSQTIDCDNEALLLAPLSSPPLFSETGTHIAASIMHDDLDAIIDSVCLSNDPLKSSVIELPAAAPLPQISSLSSDLTEIFTTLPSKGTKLTDIDVAANGALLDLLTENEVVLNSSKDNNCSLKPKPFDRRQTLGNVSAEQILKQEPPDTGFGCVANGLSLINGKPSVIVRLSSSLLRRRPNKDLVDAELGPFKKCRTSSDLIAADFEASSLLESRARKGTRNRTDGSIDKLIRKSPLFQGVRTLSGTSVSDTLVLIPDTNRTCLTINKSKLPSPIKFNDVEISTTPAKVSVAVKSPTSRQTVMDQISVKCENSELTNRGRVTNSHTTNTANSKQSLSAKRPKVTESQSIDKSKIAESPSISGETVITTKLNSRHLGNCSPVQATFLGSTSCDTELNKSLNNLCHPGESTSTVINDKYSTNYKTGKQVPVKSPRNELLTSLSNRSSKSSKRKADDCIDDNGCRETSNVKRSRDCETVASKHKVKDEMSPALVKSKTSLVIDSTGTSDLPPNIPRDGQLSSHCKATSDSLKGVSVSKSSHEKSRNSLTQTKVDRSQIASASGENQNRHRGNGTVNRPRTESNPSIVINGEVDKEVNSSISVCGASSGVMKVLPDNKKIDQLLPIITDKPLDRRKENPILVKDEPMQHPFEKIDAKIYLEKARSVKHKGDAATDRYEKLLFYIESTSLFLAHGIACEVDGTCSTTLPSLYKDTLKLIQYVCSTTKTNGHRLSSEITVLSLRLQSILLQKLFNFKRNEANKLKAALDHEMKQSMAKPLQGLSPRHTNSSSQSVNGNSTLTSLSTTSAGSWNHTNIAPSPVSPVPLPSPAGSVTSVGSAASSNGGECNGSKVCNVNGTSSVISSQRVQSMMVSYFCLISNLHQANNLWEQAEATIRSNSTIAEFYRGIDQDIERIDQCSSSLRLVEYVTTALQRLRAM